MSNFYIADWHYGHENCLHFDNRPFKTIEEMNHALVSNWNSVLSNDDTVYILGDMFWKEAEGISVLDSFKGTKVLIKGNHDRCTDEDFQNKFSLITDYLEINDKGHNIVLCHYPIVCYRNHYYGWYHFYGHVHNSFEWKMMEHDQYLMHELYGKQSMMINVGCMMSYMNYVPRTFEEILKGYTDYDQNYKRRN